MAIFQEPEEPSKAAVTTKREGLYEVHDVAKSSSPIPADEVKPLEAMRTVNIFSSLSAVYHLYKLKGTTPCTSFSVLYGERHTYFDDIESFLYVMLPFFFLCRTAVKGGITHCRNSMVRPTPWVWAARSHEALAREACHVG
jgi:hypothetical protein